MLKTLKESITFDGYILKQLQRAEKKALYQQGDDHWEVVKIRIKKLYRTCSNESSLIDQGFLSREYYPCSEEWGSYGWTYISLEEAQTKYETLPA